MYNIRCRIKVEGYMCTRGDIVFKTVRFFYSNEYCHQEQNKTIRHLILPACVLEEIQFFWVHTNILYKYNEFKK